MLGSHSFCADVLSTVSIPDLDTAAFSSSDKVIFHVDRSRLARDAHGFPPQELAPPQPSETIPLPEDAVALELLFRIIYREERVRLDSLPFENIAALSEAAEKYDAYAAIMLCRIAMEYVTSSVVPVDTADRLPSEPIAEIIHWPL